MALFNRNKTKPVVLPEVERYYDAERRERSGLAWILALVSIAGVVLVLIGLFFGGRLLYRAVTADDKPKTVATDTKKEGKSTKPSEGTTQTNNSPAPSSSSPSTTPSTPGTPTAKASSNSSTTPTTLSNTGPESVIPYFVLATIFGTLIYRNKLRKLN